MNDPLIVLTTPAPCFSKDSAVKLLAQHYGLDAVLKPLVSERDQNFMATLVDGRKFVLKIANSAEEPGVTDFQSAALLHIATADAEFPVPRLVHTSSGSTAVNVESVDGRCHRVRVLSWLDGTPLRFAEGGTSIAASLGSCLARLGRALREFQHPFSNYQLLWDIKRAAGLTSLLDNVTDAALRETCTRRLAYFTDHIEPLLSQLRTQVIYNDLNPSNVLVDPDNPDNLTGVIDFGDMVLSPLIIDVAVAAAYLCASDEDPFGEVVEFLGAYTAIVPLAEEEIAMLYDLILTRHLMTVVITNWRAARYPENRDYILRNEAKARATISGVVRLSASEVTERFRRACSAA